MDNGRYTANMDNGRYTANIFIDLKKALDTVNHGILLAKMKLSDIVNLELKWCPSYLTNRKQLSKVNGVSSKTADIGCGVPQGSCQGPLLFLIYINVLPLSLKECRRTMYADDTSISYSSTSLEGINQTLNGELTLLKQWLQGNKLSLNVLKTQVVVIGIQPKIKKITDKTTNHPKSFIGDSQVENFDRIRYLGLTIDKNLNWKELINSHCTKISRVIGFLKCTRRYLSQNILIRLYRGIVEPHFRFCCSV